MIDPKYVVKSLLKHWGTDILLQRRVFERGQGVYSIPPGDNNYFSPKLERWTVRYSFAARKVSLSAVEIGRPEGEVHGVPLVFYFTFDAEPKEGDRIYVKDDRFPEQGTIWQIKYSSPITGWGGTPAYFEAGCNRFSPS